MACAEGVFVAGAVRGPGIAPRDRWRFANERPFEQIAAELERLHPDDYRRVLARVPEIAKRREGRVSEPWSGAGSMRSRQRAGGG